MKLTSQKLLFATIAIILLDITYLWIRENYGLMNWISPKTLEFWAKDIALVIAWIIYNMKLLRMFGIGTTDAIASSETEGIINKVSTCYWFKVNTKAVRAYASDGAVYPHIIHFTYTVNNKEYKGKRYVQWNKHCPYEGEKITVYYEAEKPDNYAVIV